MADVQLDAVPVAIPEPTIAEPIAVEELEKPTTVEEPASIPGPAPISESIAVSVPVTITEPIPITEPSPPASLPLTKPPAPPSLKTLQSWLPLYLTKTDRALTHISRIIATPAGTDATLLTIGYSSLFLSSLLARLPPSFPPTTLSRRLALTARLAALSSLISDIRTFSRLFGLLGMWQWGKSAIMAPSSDPVERALVNAQVLVNTIYQILENGAYLSSKGVLGWSGEVQGKAWVWSSRCWAAHTGLEFLRLARERAVRKRAVGEKGEEEVKDLAWKRELWINAGYAPLTIHWSLEGGIISPLTIGLLGSFVGAVKMNRLWEATA
ncbi:hypothetical protein VE03_04084 [Pseudogymnoascus sp. 23342-1-I1]|nr:hypothetical protein VE03_04084 [Pseudogymnoascus sp. 23342-1-I1]